MKGYLFHEFNKRYLAEMDLQLDKLESLKQKKDIYMMPNNCTLIKPEISDDKIPFFDGKKWNYEDNLIGKKYYETDSDGFILNTGMININNLKEKKEHIKPVSTEKFFKPKFDGEKWIEGSTQEELDAIEADRLMQIELQKQAYETVKKNRPDLASVIDKKIQDLNK
jgi:hypothetical protein